MRLTLALCAALALTGCGTSKDATRAQSDFNTSIDNLALALHSEPAPQPPAPQPKPACASFRAWTDADLKGLGQALEPIDAASPIMRMALDWRRYYGDAKACNGAGAP